jgi:hypothetical protein
MPRPPLPIIGTWGCIRTQVVKTDERGKAVSHRAQAKYRDHDGQTRLVSAFGKTKTAAENNLLKKLKERAKTSLAGQLTAMHKIRHAIELWETNSRSSSPKVSGHPARWTPTAVPSRTTSYLPSARFASVRPAHRASTE